MSGKHLQNRSGAFSRFHPIWLRQEFSTITDGVCAAKSEAEEETAPEEAQLCASPSKADCDAQNYTLNSCKNKKINSCLRLLLYYN